MLTSYTRGNVEMLILKEIFKNFVKKRLTTRGNGYKMSLCYIIKTLILYGGN